MKFPRERYDLGEGWAVEFRFDGRQMDVDWFPRFPPFDTGMTLLPAYRLARDDFLSKLAPAYGTIVVAEI